MKVIKYILGFIFWAVLSQPFLVFGQKGSSYTLGGKSLSMGNSGVTSTDVDAIFLNQAGLASIDQLSAIVSSERKFNLPELTGVSLGLVLPTERLGSFGLQLSNYGSSVYSEQKVGVAYARSIAKNTFIGAQLDLLNTTIDQFGNAMVATFEVGLITRIVDQVYLGFHAFSPAQIALTDNESVPGRLRIGLSYLPSEKVELRAEVDQFLDTRPAFKGGISYMLVPSVFLRTGFSTSPTEGKFSFGAAYQWKSRLRIDLAFSIHEFLGTTPGISIIYQNPTKKVNK